MRLRLPLRVRERDPLRAEARAARIELGDWFNAPLHPDVDESPGSVIAGACVSGQSRRRERW